MLKIFTGVIVGIAIAVGIASRWIFKKKPDNPLEEAVERVIYRHTGYDIDLSPDTPDPQEGY